MKGGDREVVALARRQGSAPPVELDCGLEIDRRAQCRHQEVVKVAVGVVVHVEVPEEDGRDRRRRGTSGRSAARCRIWASTAARAPAVVPAIVGWGACVCVRNTSTAHGCPRALHPRVQGALRCRDNRRPSIDGRRWRSIATTGCRLRRRRPPPMTSRSPRGVSTVGIVRPFQVAGVDVAEGVDDAGAIAVAPHLGEPHHVGLPFPQDRDEVVERPLGVDSLVERSGQQAHVLRIEREGACRGRPRPARRRAFAGRRTTS